MDGLGGNAQNHQYSRGLPTVAPHYRNVPLRMPGDLDGKADRVDILSRHDTRDTIDETPSAHIDPGSIPESHGVPDCSTDNVACFQWLKKVTNGNCHPKAATPDTLQETPDDDWNYAQRREAQAVTPFLFLGPAKVAKDAEFLQSNQITMVLVVRDSEMAPSGILEPRTATRLGIPAVKIDFRRDKLVSKFEEAVAAINAHMAERHARQQATNDERAFNRQPLDTSLPARILVYDLTGNEASAVVVGAYLLVMYGCKAWEATFVIHSQRFCVSAQFVNEYMVRWFDIVEARKQTNTAKLGAMNVNVDTQPVARKRSMVVEQEEDDWARFGIGETGQDEGDSEVGSDGRRRIAAPFQDREEHYDSIMTD